MYESKNTTRLCRSEGHGHLPSIDTNETIRLSLLRTCGIEKILVKFKRRVYNRTLVDLPRREVVLTCELDILIASAPENHRVSGLGVEQRNSKGGLNVDGSAPIKGCGVCGPALKHK